MKNRMTIKPLLLAAGLAACLAASAAHVAQAALPGLTPAQQQAAADKKAKDAAQAAKDKQALSDSMDAVAAHWRTRAASQGWKTHPPVAIAAAAPPAGAPAAGASAAGINTAASSNGPAAQPAGQLTQAGANLPIRSEKLGTAPPSGDVKARPTPSLPAGTPPTVVKGTPKVKNK